MVEPVRIRRKYEDTTFQKFIYHKDTNGKLHAGGLLIYDDTGIWVLKEFFKVESFKFIDPGGKYNYQDCNIYQTIVREFSEETYLGYPFSYSELITLLENGKALEVYTCHQDPDKTPAYLCILVHLSDIEELKGKKLDMDSKIFHENREKVLKENPMVPLQYFPSFDFVHLKFVDIRKNIQNIHFRLKQVLHKSFLKKYIYEDIPDKIIEETVD